MGANVPDYRGMFLRGHGGNSANLGVVQNDAIRNITGRFFPGNNFGYAGCLYGNGVFRCGGEYWNNSGNYLALGNGKTTFSSPNSWVTTGEFAFDISRQVPVAAENRPTNMAVKWLIFVGD